MDGSAGEDNSVKELSKKRGVKLSVIEGVSKVSAAVDAAGFSGCSYQAVSAYELAETRLTAPLVVYDMPDREIAGDVKLALMDRFGDEKEVLYICGGRSKRIPLYELDRQEEYDGTSAVALEKPELLDKRGSTLPTSKRSSSGSAVRTAARGTRCRPPESIRMNAVEEAYELVDAIDSGEEGKILEEAGDILLQAVFQAVMAEERGAFFARGRDDGGMRKADLPPYAPSSAGTRRSDEAGALSVWEKNKMKEKHQETFSDAVNDVPRSFRPPAGAEGRQAGGERGLGVLFLRRGGAQDGGGTHRIEGGARVGG